MIISLKTRQEALKEMERLYNEINNGNKKHTEGKTLIYLLNVMALYFKDSEGLDELEAIKGYVSLNKMLRKAREKKEAEGNDNGKDTQKQ